jgi:hypothetical protein
MRCLAILSLILLGLVCLSSAQQRFWVPLRAAQQALAEPEPENEPGNEPENEPGNEPEPGDETATVPADENCPSGFIGPDCDIKSSDVDVFIRFNGDKEDVEASLNFDGDNTISFKVSAGTFHGICNLAIVKITSDDLKTGEDPTANMPDDAKSVLPRGFIMVVYDDDNNGKQPSESFEVEICSDDLSDDDAGNLGLYYFDEDSGEWINVLANCDGEDKTFDSSSLCTTYPVCHLTQFNGFVQQANGEPETLSLSTSVSLETSDFSISLFSGSGSGSGSSSGSRSFSTSVSAAGTSRASFVVQLVMAGAALFFGLWML